MSADLLPEARGAIAFVRGITPDKANRQRDDFYPTPPEATRLFLDAEHFDGDIWEPAGARYLFDLSQVHVKARDHALYQFSDLLPSAPSVARCHVQQCGVGAVRDGAQAMRG